MRKASFYRSDTLFKIVGKSLKYKHVRIVSDSSKKELFQGFVLGEKAQFAIEKEAGLWVDKILIKNGKDPVNILKK